ncbi:MAG TPA: PqqD family protein [Solirubrobacteraceae bacterium]|nr:PqqD family protein [Solirubrobacteraceae bacterium]
MSVAEDVAWEKVDGLVVMLTLSSEHYYRLDETATRMWEVLDECADVSSAFEQLHAEYEVEPATLREDLGVFIARLGDAGVLVVEPADS